MIDITTYLARGKTTEGSTVYGCPMFKLLLGCDNMPLGHACFIVDTETGRRTEVYIDRLQQSTGVYDKGHNLIFVGDVLNAPVARRNSSGAKIFYPLHLTVGNRKDGCFPLLKNKEQYAELCKPRGREKYTPDVFLPSYLHELVEYDLDIVRRGYRDTCKNVYKMLPPTTADRWNI